MDLKNKILLDFYKPTKKETNLLFWKRHVRMTKTDAYRSNKLKLQNHSITTIRKNKSVSFQLLTFYLVHPWPSKLMLPWTSYIEQTMWILANAKTDLDYFFAPRMIPISCMQNSKFSRKMTTKTSDWYKILPGERQFSTSFCDWGVTWSLFQQTLLERKSCPQCWYLQCPKTWRNNSKSLTRWLT